MNDVVSQDRKGAAPARRRGVVGLVLLVGASSLTTGCLPLPPDVKAAVCADPSTYVPASHASAPTVAVSGMPTPVPAPIADLLNRLAAWPTMLEVTPTPVVTVTLLDVGPTSRDTAAALRKEFGSAIDIELGAKRLGGGVNGSTEACLLVTPGWALGEPAPKGITVSVTPDAPSFDRHAMSVTATVKVTNRTKRTIRAYVPASPLVCRPITLAGALTSVTSPLSNNVAFDVRSTDALRPFERSGFDDDSFLRSAPPTSPAAGTWMAAKDPCFAADGGPLPTIAPGRSETYRASASTLSLQPGPDPVLTAGTYDLRMIVSISPTGALDTTWKSVAAPPVRVELRG